MPRAAARLRRVLGAARKGTIWLSAAVLLVILLLVAVDYLVDEPLRRRMERTLNDRLHGYTVRLSGLDFHVAGFALDLEGLTVVQQANPDPPVAHIPKLTASVQWRELLTGNVVADFRFDRPAVHVNLQHFRAEAKDPVPVTERGWQEALQAIYPFKINELNVVDGDVTYVDEGPFKPLHIRQLNFTAGNIRNIRSKAHTYPSTVSLDGRVFDSGTIRLEGRADFLARPHFGIKAAAELKDIELDYLKPITSRYNAVVQGGLLGARGAVEYAHDDTTVVHLDELTVRGVRIDYVHTPATAGAEKQRAETVKRTAEQASNKPDLWVRVDRAMILDSTVGFVNKAATPEYRVFLSDTRLEVRNLSNHLTEGTAVASLQGRFLGSGVTVAKATFRPEVKGPDFDLAVSVENTDMRTMNDLLRAYGKFDVVRGTFSLFSELSVKEGRIEGYVKPLFSDMQVYDKRQDQEKSAFRKLYERLVGGVAKLLENIPRDEVATKAEISGPLEDPRTSTWQVIVRLIQNAFFRAILPGFDAELGRAARGRGA